MTKRHYDPALREEIHNLLEACEVFRQHQAERARQREETARRLDAAIMMSELPPDAD